MYPEAGKPPNAEVETRATGAESAPNAQPGLQQMVMMVDTRNGPAAHQGSSNDSETNGGEWSHRVQR